MWSGGLGSKDFPFKLPVRTGVPFPWAMLLQANTYHQVSGKVGGAEFARPMNWIPLEKQYPQADEHVMVKMDDGAVEIGYWDAARAGWTHSPFERWGVPVAWAALPPQYKGEG